MRNNRRRLAVITIAAAAGLSRYRSAAVLGLELSANNGLTLPEVGLKGAALQLALAALDAVVHCGASSASRLEAAAMLRDGWRPGRPMFLIGSDDLDLDLYVDPIVVSAVMAAMSWRDLPIN
jgi:hypothetical protein